MVIESKTLIIVRLVKAKVITSAPSLHCYCSKVVQVTFKVEFGTKPKCKAKATKNGKKLSHISIWRYCRGNRHVPSMRIEERLVASFCYHVFSFHLQKRYIFEQRGSQHRRLQSFVHQPEHHLQLQKHLRPPREKGSV